jgi:DNA repair exonuclease SbcCD ATPase subunit
MSRAVLSAFVVCLAAVCSAQSIGELAEKQKKARKGQPAKVITAEDLKNPRARVEIPPAQEPSGGAASEAAKPPAGADAAKPEKTEEEQRAEKRAEIEKKIKEHQDRIADVRAQMDAAQTELNDLSTLTYGGRREALMKLLAEGEAEIAKANQAIADLQEQARRAGLPIAR